MFFDKGKKIAKEIKRKYSNSDIRVICNYLGVMVREQNMGTGAKGLYLTDAETGKAVITVNSLLSQSEQKLAIAVLLYSRFKTDAILYVLKDFCGLDSQTRAFVKELTGAKL